MKKNKILIILIILVASINGYATPVVKPEIQQIKFWGAKWHINYNEIKNGINLLKEELFVDGNSDRIVTLGTTERRGFPLHGSYALDACHKAYVVVYDKEHNIASKSNIFNFGDLSKCDGMGDSDTTNPIITLRGDNPQTIILGNAYKELGAIASDNIDGDLTSSIAIDTTAIDTATLGEYVVTYSVLDVAGNDTLINRVVKVINASNIGSSEIIFIKYFSGKWNISYKDVATSANLGAEKLFVDGKLDRQVNAGTNSLSLRRGFGLHGTYDATTCHTAYLVTYDKAGDELSRTAEFNFGDTSKCVNTMVVPTAPDAVTKISLYGNYIYTYDSETGIETIIDAHEYYEGLTFNDNSTNETGFHVYLDGVLLKTVPAHKGTGKMRIGIYPSYPPYNTVDTPSSGEIENIVVKAFNEAGESEASNRLLMIIPDESDNGRYTLNKIRKTGLYRVDIKSEYGSFRNHSVKFFYLKNGKVTYTILGYDDYLAHGFGRQSTMTINGNRAIFNSEISTYDETTTPIVNYRSETVVYDISDLLNISIIN